MPANQPKSAIIWKNNPAYPPLLREISDSPERLFFLGKTPDPAESFFAVVGTRHATSYGKQMAKQFTTGLTRGGFHIVSGLAYGIDAIAHQAALDAGGKTTAVLGSGLHNISPPCNIPLANDIQKNGTVLTEYEDNFEARPGTFPQRNRIIAGMSLATLVIEAPEKSGALITARLALEYNRDVFALPANLTQESGLGSNRLIRDSKAFPVTCLDDIFKYLELSGITLPPHTAQSKNKMPGAGPLNADEEAIYSLLQKSPRSVDELVAETELPTARINTLLSFLELKGLVKISGSQALVTR